MTPGTKTFDDLRGPELLGEDAAAKPLSHLFDRVLMTELPAKGRELREAAPGEAIEEQGVIGLELRDQLLLTIGERAPFPTVRRLRPLAELGLYQETVPTVEADFQ